MDICLLFKDRASSLAGCITLHSECNYGFVSVTRIFSNFKIVLCMWKYHPLLKQLADSNANFCFALPGQIFQKLPVVFPRISR